jgi:hypothetical protein
VLGVCHVPVTNKTYYAVKGKGAYVREADGATRQIHAKEFEIGEEGLTIVGSSSHANPSNNTGVWGCGGVGGQGGAAHHHGVAFVAHSLGAAARPAPRVKHTGLPPVRRLSCPPPLSASHG